MGFLGGLVKFACCAAAVVAAPVALPVAGAVAVTGATAAGIVTTGATVATGRAIYKYGEKKIDEAEARGRRQGYDHGYKEGKIKAADEFQALLEKNENLLFGVLALALYVARLDGEDEQEVEYIENCIGDGELRREEIRYEIKNIYKNEYNFSQIRSRYLDKVSAGELKYVDGVIKGVIDADGYISQQEKQFYDNVWLPYIQQL